jgi:hypothetical protein
MIVDISAVIRTGHPEKKLEALPLEPFGLANNIVDTIK